MSSTAERLWLGSILLAAVAPLQAAEMRTIPNELKMRFPWDMVYMDFPEGSQKEPLVVHLVSEERPSSSKDKKSDRLIQPVKDGWVRPAQIEKVTVDGKPMDRVWFVATLSGEETAAQVTFRTQEIAPGIRMRAEGDYYLIDNGVYELRLRKYGELPGPTPIGSLKHWLGGMRVKGHQSWDGKAFFEGSGKVIRVESTILNKGPVFVDVHLRYVFECDTPEGKVGAVPLMLGKWSHTYKPNRVPSEDVPLYEMAYDVAIRFVMGDPWIEVVERYHLPPDPTVKSWGIHQYNILWGATRDDLPYNLIDIPRDEHEKIDTVTWVRWFLYDQFGGNSRQETIAAEPRPDQKGRPFALLRPRWNQGGGGAQDFVLTRGGERPPDLEARSKAIESRIGQLKDAGAWEGKAEEAEAIWQKVRKGTKAEKTEAAAKVATLLGIEFPEGIDYSEDHPAFGIVAAYPSKWCNPYPSTISAYVREDQRGCRFPLVGGAGSTYYSARCYALCAGPRKMFSNLNDLVRRHTDWTLAAQNAHYILRWERDPSVAGANILISRERLAALRVMMANNPEAEALQAFHEAFEKADLLTAERTAAQSITEQNPKSEEGKAAAGKIKDLDKQLESRDMQIVAFLRGGEQAKVRLPDPGTYLNTRYQDDANNPTNYGNRRQVNSLFPLADLLSVGKPFGGAQQAAIGYIYTDLDAWPGWHNGWTPGNPNFHTDKYLASIFAAAAMQDHPHAKEWMAFGIDNFQADLAKVLIAPDGVGMECPGYSGYSIGLQLEIAGAIHNSGMGNPIADNPLVKKTGRWHRKLLTPFDKRIGRRHEAPHGDTHRWESGLNFGFARLAPYFQKTDPVFASELMGTYRFLQASGVKMKGKGLESSLEVDYSIPAMPVEKMDWSSEFFYGFGPIMRSGFGTDQETFLSLKAGPARGHYHNDELAWHYYADGTPISVDYNCSYHPRGDHAGLHNTSTFGKAGMILHNGRNVEVPAMEQAFGTAHVGAFVSTPAADLVVAERSNSGLTMSPIDPDDAEFQRQYPYRETGNLVHRRTLLMVKHPRECPLTDYLVVREEFQNLKEPQQINIHLLAREINRTGDTFLAVGQYDKDVQLSVFQSTDLSSETRSWYYSDEWMMHPDDNPYVLREGEHQADWAARMEKLKKDRGLPAIPAPDWQPLFGDGRSSDPKNPKSTVRWRRLIEKTGGKALMPPPGWTASWMYGEYQLWLRLSTAPGSTLAYVMYPYKHGAPRPEITSLPDGGGVRVSLGEASDEIHFKPNGECLIRSGEKTTILLREGEVPALCAIPSSPPAILRYQKP
ncbi:MAG: hypothetical protein HS116_12080 [Planctomycetes bacterium]|nr:hypothetical protein [Planctomycetota bacterium]